MQMANMDRGEVGSYSQTSRQHKEIGPKQGFIGHNPGAVLEYSPVAIYRNAREFLLLCPSELTFFTTHTRYPTKSRCAGPKNIPR